MPGLAMTAAPSALWRWAMGRLRPDRRGTVGVVAAVSFVPLLLAAGVGIDMSRVTSGRSALQRMVDNAALSGAAAYVLYTATDSFNAVAKNVAKSSFCNAAAAPPPGLVLVASGGVACGTSPGPVISAVIAGYAAGSRGVVAGSGCTNKKTVVVGATCGFVVTGTAQATIPSMFAGLMGKTSALTASASAINPFIDIGTALTPTMKGSARYANSVWVYPLVLDANGSPDFTVNQGAIPDASTCTGDPTQTSCGSFTMLASTRYIGCITAAPCTVNGTVFGGAGGVVQNPVAGASVITATTPLGVAFAAAAGGDPNAAIAAAGGNPAAINPYGYSGSPLPADSGCAWPGTVAYNTVPQTYSLAGDPQLPWALTTHWYYSSYLLNNYPPSQGEILFQQSIAINATTGLSAALQSIPAVPMIGSGVQKCPDNTYAAGNVKLMATTFPTTGNTNCSLYIVKDPTTLTPNPTYVHNNVCWTPAATQGRAYAGLSCQSFAGHNYAFFWNDMGGRTDDTDYGNGTLQISCKGPTSVLLIN